MSEDIKQQIEVCARLKQQGLTRQQIADELGISERQVKRRLSSEYAKKFTMDNVEPTDFYPFQTDMNNTMTDEYNFLTKVSLHKDKSLFNYEQVEARRKEIKKLIERQFCDQSVKILYIADIHIPFADYTKLFQVINDHEDADFVIINGDFLDLYAVSKFAKDKEIALRREIDEGREVLEIIARKFKHVVITSGNHERRLQNMIRNLIPPDMQFLFRQDILKMMVDGEVLDKDELTNVHVVGDWWINLWDIIFAHPDNFSSAPMRTVINTSQHFLLARQLTHRMCVIGHTHQAGEIILDGIKMMETGCISHPMDYNRGSKFTKNAWTQAHAVFYVDSYGKADFNTSRIAYI